MQRSCSHLGLRKHTPLCSSQNDKTPNGASLTTTAPIDKWHYHCAWVTTKGNLFWRPWLKGSWNPLCAAHTSFWLYCSICPEAWICDWYLWHLLVHSQGHPYARCGLAFFGSYSLPHLPVSLDSVWPLAPLIMTMNHKFFYLPLPWFFNSCQ